MTRDKIIEACKTAFKATQGVDIAPSVLEVFAPMYIKFAELIQAQPTSSQSEPKIMHRRNCGCGQCFKPQPTSQDMVDAERWRHFACNQTAMMLGSELEPMDNDVNWLEECNRLADVAMKKVKV